MRVNVKNYTFRLLDRMLIVQTENDEILFLYCPNYWLDTHNTGYVIDIEYVEYYDNYNSHIQCDGVVEFIQHNIRRFEYPWIRHDKIPASISKKAGIFRNYYNSREIIEEDIARRKREESIAALCDMFKYNGDIL